MTLKAYTQKSQIVDNIGVVLGVMNKEDTQKSKYLLEGLRELVLDYAKHYALSAKHTVEKKTLARGHYSDKDALLSGVLQNIEACIGYEQMFGKDYIAKTDVESSTRELSDAAFRIQGIESELANIGL